MYIQMRFEQLAKAYKIEQCAKDCTFLKKLIKKLMKLMKSINPLILDVNSFKNLMKKSNLFCSIELDIFFRRFQNNSQGLRDQYQTLINHRNQISKDQPKINRRQIIRLGYYRIKNKINLAKLQQLYPKKNKQSVIKIKEPPQESFTQTQYYTDIFSTKDQAEISIRTTTQLHCKILSLECQILCLNTVLQMKQNKNQTLLQKNKDHLQIIHQLFDKGQQLRKQNRTIQQKCLRLEQKLRSTLKKLKKKIDNERINYQPFLHQAQQFSWFSD